MESDEITFAELAYKLRHNLAESKNPYPLMLASALCLAIEQDKKRDALFLFNLLKDYLTDNNLSYLFNTRAKLRLVKSDNLVEQLTLF